MLFAFHLAVLDFSCKDVSQFWLVLSNVSFLQINTNLNFLFSSGSVYLFWFIFCGTFSRTGWLKSFGFPLWEFIIQLGLCSFGYALVPTRVVACANMILSFGVLS